METCYITSKTRKNSSGQKPHLSSLFYEVFSTLCCLTELKELYSTSMQSLQHAAAS